jgi:hypothetical protein
MIKLDNRITTRALVLHDDQCLCGCNASQFVDPIFLCDDNSTRPQPIIRWAK